MVLASGVVVSLQQDYHSCVALIACQRESPSRRRTVLVNRCPMVAGGDLVGGSGAGGQRVIAGPVPYSSVAACRRARSCEARVALLQ
jgi:hypothetical protein